MTTLFKIIGNESPYSVEQFERVFKEIHRGTFELLHKNTQFGPWNPTKITWTQNLKNKWEDGIFLTSGQGTK